jgi:hypothetical protein
MGLRLFSKLRNSLNTRSSNSILMIGSELSRLGIVSVATIRFLAHAAA